MHSPDEVAAQIAKIRLEIEQERGATVGCEELRILCPKELSVSAQFMCIVEIAQKEGWSFAFLADGRVRFGAYGKA